MRKFKISVACLILSSSIICSSCIGSFGLWSSLKDWNNINFCCMPDSEQQHYMFFMYRFLRIMEQSERLEQQHR